MPKSVSLYSTRGGTSGKTSLSIIPFSSNERRLAVNTFWLTPLSDFFNSPKRLVLVSKFLKISIVHLLLSKSNVTSTGQAKITAGYNLPAKHVIHTVGPIIYRVVEDDDKELLSSCYRNSLKLALENNLKSIAFCCISTGEFRFPNNLAAEIAVDEVKKFFRENPNADLKVVFNVFKDLDKKLYEDILG